MAVVPKRNNTEVKASLNNFDSLERPVFINKNLENKQTNFVDLNKEDDVNIISFNLVISQKLK